MIAILVLFFLSNCTSRQLVGEYYLDPETREYMPTAGENITYINQDNKVVVCQTVTIENRMKVIGFDSYGFRATYYNNEYEKHTLHFKDFTITYTFQAEKNNGVNRNYLSLQVSDSDSYVRKSNKATAEIETPGDTTGIHWENSAYLDSLAVGNRMLYQVYELSGDLPVFYLKKGIGLATFQLGDDTWVAQ